MSAEVVPPPRTKTVLPAGTAVVLLLTSVIWTALTIVLSIVAWRADALADHHHAVAAVATVMGLAGFVGMLVGIDDLVRRRLSPLSPSPSGTGQG